MTEKDKPSEVTEELVRKLLQMNPNLRGDGKTTKEVLETVRGNLSGTPSTPQAAPTSSSAAVGKAPNHSPPSRPATAAAPDLDGVLLRCSRQHDAALLEQKKEDDAIAAALRTCDDEERRARQRAHEIMIEAILGQDPGLQRPENLAVIDREKAFLSTIAFTLEKLLAAKRKRGK